MKKVLMILCLIALSVVFIHGYADAKVTGTCSSCHTMHNSQNNAEDQYDSDDTPTAKLLKGGCIGCHAQDTAANVVNTIPQVLHAGTATDLAGGNFTYIIDNDDSYGHNVEGVGAIADDATNATPPGYVSAYDPGNPDFAGNDLTCAGSQGCHGIRTTTDEFAAVSGAHHGDDSILQYGTDFTLTGQGTSIVTSYRMLNGVKGAEDPDWEGVSPSATAHNSYYSKAYGARTTQSATATVSELCASCHGAFHMSGIPADDGIGVASPWYRHPTDVLIPNSGDYSAISTTYDIETPVGRTALADDLVAADVDSVSIAGQTETVICLSCHRAHASDQPDILRFSYTTQTAGTGCLHCHTGKDPFSP